MKKITIYKLMAFLVTIAVFAVSCTKEMSEVRLEPTLSTAQTMHVTSDSATVTGFIVAEGDGFTERGVCYHTSANPTIENSKVVYTADTPEATFKVILTKLNYATKYYARAYAKSELRTVYGEEVTFTTLPVVPVLTTTAITEITGSSAITGGNITVSGGAAVTARGVCYGTTQNPTIAGTKTTNGEGVGIFTSTLSQLKGNTTYYVRAYATNSAGTAYGPEVTFKTLVDLPVVTTYAVSAITKVSAFTGGEITYDGGAPITAKGVVYSLNPEPTLNDKKIEGGSGTSAFISNLIRLEKFTKYYVRAYATNSAGTAYGNEVQFTTLADIFTWNIPGNYVAASYPGSDLADWSPAKSPQVISTVAAPDALEGYVYMANASNEWKFATQPNWDGPNYGTSGGGKLDAAAGNIISPAGYYKINADAKSLTYTAVATVWGVIGDATPNSWNTETVLKYNPALRVWRGVVHLTAKEFKFRANQNWGYNYGSDLADGKLKHDGKNIPVDVEADYVVELDLSKPNNYTYKINRWGLIGDATPGGWGTDTDMTWDNTKQVFTVTLNLVSSGTFKFRANDGWDLNYGGDLGSLTPGGANIGISADGNYTITFDPFGLKATVTKN